MFKRGFTVIYKTQKFNLDRLLGFHLTDLFNTYYV